MEIRDPVENRWILYDIDHGKRVAVRGAPPEPSGHNQLYRGAASAVRHPEHRQRERSADELLHVLGAVGEPAEEITARLAMHDHDLQQTQNWYDRTSRCRSSASISP